MKSGIIALCLAFLSFIPIPAQIIKPVKWAFSTRKVDAAQVDLVFKATITSPWHMYGLNIAEGGPIPTSISFESTKGFETVGKPGQNPKPEVVDDKIFNMKLELHSGQVTFTQRIKRTSADSIIIKGILEYMTCSDMQCVLGDQDFEFRLEGLGKLAVAGAEGSKEKLAAAGADGSKEKSAAAAAEGSKEESAAAAADGSIEESVVAEGSEEKSAAAAADSSEEKLGAAAAEAGGKRGLWGAFFIALVAGLGGLLTPCVYPMIPLTVSFFLRGNKSRSRAISEALVFGFSIVLLYTLIGVLVAIFKNPNAVNNFTTHWATNTIFFLVFILLSASFFGMFEIILPSGFANKVDQQADKGGYLGAFFMAVAMAVLSFSCTGPIVASLLIKASQGEVLEPVVGMAGFSFILALPFTLFAIFPSWLQSLPKSGGWLNGIKVFFAFIMLAFSLYFLAKIDQSYHLNLISRSLFLSIWVVIFALLGIYLLGKIRFAHDSDIQHLGVPRFIFSVVSFSFALYLFTGLFGNELKGLSSIIPPPPLSSVTSQVHGTGPEGITQTLCSTPRHSDMLTLPHGLKGYFDYNEALACAKELNKPVLVDFVGHTCSNCKKMYADVWSDPRVLQLLNEKFIVVALYTDDKTKLPDTEWITSSSDGKVKNSIGKINQDLQITRFNSNALPLYAIVDGNGNNLASTYYTYNPDIEKFIAWLESI